MKKGFVKHLLGTVTAAVMCLASIPTISTNISSSAANVGDKLSVGGGQNQHKGNCDGYSYEIWLDTTGGSGNMTLGKGATFKAEWSASVNAGNFLARRGLDFGSKQKATSYEYIGMDYKADYKQTGSASGNSRLCVYGWFQNQGVGGNVPLVEYYIIEDWVDWCPDAPGKTVTIDGAQYKIFQMDHSGPSINSGYETFKQYFSVRQSKRKSGHITVSDHFKAWANEGWGIGNLYEVALNAEGWQSSGYADVTELDVYTTPGPTTPTEPTEPTQPPTPPPSGYYFKNDFESSVGDWKGRGAASVEKTSSASAGGSNSLYVSGRTDTWNGASIELDSSEFIPGNTYSFGCYAMQNSSSSEEMKLTLQYNDASGTEQYADVAKADAVKGTWTKLENTKYTIPEGASNLLLYVESVDSTTNFYIDDAFGAVSGTSQTMKSKLGDANQDGKIDIADCVALSKYLLGKSTDIDKDAADVSNDGILDIFDLAGLRSYVINYVEPVIPVEPETQAPTTTKKQEQQQQTGKLDSSKPIMAISFDDGTQQYGTRICDALAKEGFRATFFYVGNWITDQNAVKHAYQCGMEIANHTTTHPHLPQQSSSQIRSEYDQCYNKLKSIIGAEPSKLMRLPYLESNQTVQQTLYDVPLISCAIDTQDWNNASKDAIVGTIKGGMSNRSADGAIILCHETYATTAGAIEEIAPYAKSQGWQIGTISEMFAAKGKQLNGGQVYTRT